MEEYIKLLDDFRTVAKALVRENPEMKSWLIKNWPNELQGYI